MSISPATSLLSSIPATPGTAVAAQNGELQTQISQYSIKDEIKLSKEAVSLLLAAGQGIAPQ